MKIKILLLGFLLLGPNFLFGSNKDSINPDLNKCRFSLVLYGIGSSSMYATTKVPIGMTFNFNIKKHAFYVGANFLTVGRLHSSFLSQSSDYLYNNHLVNNLGIMAGYQRYLFPMSNRLNVYLEYTFNSFTSKIANVKGNRIATDYILTNTLGYGIKFRLLKKFFLYQSLGLGLYYTFIEYPKDTRIYSDSDYIFTAKFGLGYDF